MAFFLVLLSFLTQPFHSFGQHCFQPHHDSLLRLKDGFRTLRGGSGLPHARFPSFQTISATRCTLSSWVPNTDCCRWQGITCDASSRYVVSLDMAGCNFRLPPVIFFELFNLTTLRALDLSGNFVPRTGFELPKDSNQSRCPFPKPTFQLKLASCNITIFPKFLRDCYIMNELDLSGNQMTGLIPDWIWDMVPGVGLNLSNNMLTGFQIPLHREQPPSFLFLDLHNNRLNASFPIFDIISYLIVSKNNLFGNLPSSICNLTSLQVLDVSDNNLSGQIPTCLSQMGGLKILNLRGNNFRGILPPTMFSASYSLQILDLNSNMFEGPFLSPLFNCKYLEVLNIGNNLFNDTFPKMNKLTKLRILILRGNKFEGTLESLDIQSEVLQFLDLSSNDFSGTLQPNSFLNMKAMIKNTSDNQGTKLEYLNLGYYQQSFVFSWKGGQVHFGRMLAKCTVINLSNNKFQGKIPDVIGNLTALHTLDLSHNKLFGSIPTSFGRLRDLDSLDFSWNNLSGEIPMQLDSLDYLGYLNLSKNFLSGRIPFNGHLRTLPNSSYIGNDNLCGAPLLKECEASPPMLQNNDSRNNNYEVWEECNMLYICFSFGFCSGLTFFIVAMLICTDGRRWIFFHVDKVLYKVLPPGFWH